MTANSGEFRCGVPVAALNAREARLAVPSEISTCCGILKNLHAAVSFVGAPTWAEQVECCEGCPGSQDTGGA